MSDIYQSPSGKIHVRRRVWYAGTPDERAADILDMVITLCGQRRELKEMPADTEITCRTCQHVKKNRKED